MATLVHKGEARWQLGSKITLWRWRGGNSGAAKLRRGGNSGAAKLHVNGRYGARWQLGSSKIALWQMEVATREQQNYIVGARWQLGSSKITLLRGGNSGAANYIMEMGEVATREQQNYVVEIEAGNSGAAKLHCRESRKLMEMARWQLGGSKYVKWARWQPGSSKVTLWSCWLTSGIIRLRSCVRCASKSLHCAVDPGESLVKLP